MQQGQPNDGRLIKMRVRQMDVEERIDEVDINEFGRRIHAIKKELSREKRATRVHKKGSTNNIVPKETVICKASRSSLMTLKPRRDT